jgi:hypothetical protein
MRRISAESYYDSNPGLAHASGDIWSDFPTHGILGQEIVSAMVVSPACDLAQGKVDVITYLPILPLRAYFSSTAALPDVRRAIDGQLAVANLKGLLDLPAIYTIPPVSMLDSAESLLSEHESSGRLGQKERAALLRVAAGLKILREIARPGLSEVAVPDLSLLFGDKEWANMKSRMVTNSYRTDVHFLPADGQRPEWTGVAKHSLVLFRYPLTAPLEIIDAAQDLSLADWPQWCRQTAERVPCAERFGRVRPMKRLTLREEFISDLLTRFVALFVRLGSPDFSADTILQYSKEID